MELVLASSNQCKLKELRHLLVDLNIDVLSQSKFNIADAVEDGDSFIANALIKAKHASKLSGLSALADDSGLVVEYLSGAPGIYSARYAGENAQDVDNMMKLLVEMENCADQSRQAKFVCALVFVRNFSDPDPVVATGEWQGSIARYPQGENGFGYDPVFYVSELNCTSAMLSQTEKSKLSHRSKALAQLKTELRKYVS